MKIIIYLFADRYKKIDSFERMVEIRKDLTTESLLAQIKTYFQDMLMLANREKVKTLCKVLFINELELNKTYYEIKDKQGNQQYCMRSYDDPVCVFENDEQGEITRYARSTT